MNFRYLHSIPAHLRFFAREFPMACVEKTPLFNRDDEIISLIMTAGEEVTGQAVRNLDFVYINEKLFEHLMTLNGAWGTLMRIADRHLHFHETGSVLRLKLLKFLLQDRYLHRLFMHPTGEIIAMTPDGARLMLLKEFNMVLARPWPVTPVNIHPVDIWSSYPHGRCDITECLERIFTTNGNHIPPRHEFYLNHMRNSWEHANMVKSTMRRLATLDFTGMGVSVGPLLDVDGSPVCFHSAAHEPVMLLWPSGTVDLNRINLTIQKHMGLSVLSALTGPKLMSAWTWFAFRVQPIFSWICPSFDACGLPNHPRKIIQVTCYARDVFVLFMYVFSYYYT